MQIVYRNPSGVYHGQYGWNKEYRGKIRGKRGKLALAAVLNGF